ncbi:MAG TPA: ABC transporter permease [Gemmatimonadales bacterium]|nr:ABC transporter permease [Gemmatimonadales bacterium]
MEGGELSSWVVRRLVDSTITFALALTLAFFLMRVAPGDPLARVTEGRTLSPAEVAALRTRYGLEQPLIRQFGSFVEGLVRGDLGVSIEYGRPVTALLAERLPATVLLGGSVLLLNFSLGLWLGVRQAVRRGTAEDRWLTALSLMGYAIPSFWLGLVLAWLIGIELRLLPAAGMQDPLLGTDAGFLARAVDLLRHLVLPAVTLSVVSIAATMRYQRTAMLEVLQLPFITTARAKGLREQDVTWRHAWRNALFPVITLFGLWLPLLVTGSVFVEAVFAWPGLGSLAASAVWGRDYPVIMGCVLLVAGLVVTAGFLTDLAYTVLDPRVRLA